MSTRKEKKLNIVLGACAGVLVLAGGLCVLLLGGEDKGAQLVQATPETTMTPAPTVTEIPQANIVVSTPEVDLVAEKHRQEMEAIAIRNIMLPGTTVYGVNVGGMSRDEAKAAVEERLVRDPLIVNLQLSDGTNLYPASGEGIDTLLASTKVAQEEEEDDDAVDPAMKAAEAAADTEPEPETTDPTDTESIGIRLNIDVDKAVTEAFSLMRDMNVPYDTFMLQVQQIASGKDVAPVPGYDIDSVNRFIEYLSEFLDTPAVNSSITMKDNQIVYTLEAIGQGIDREALVETILNTDPLSGKTISIPIHDLEPTITQEMLQSKFVLRGSYTTSFSDSTKNRKYNIRFGAEKINGIILKPGDVFSANDTLGTRTRKNGWKNAGAYESGEVVQQAGGGVCQLSSTLYNAALYADMEIVERSDVIIMAYTDGNILHMEIYGVPFETDEYDRIEIRTKQRGSVSIKTVYEYDDSKPASYSKTITKGSKGYTVQTYKDYYLGQTLVKTDDLGISKYTMFPKKVLVGTIEESSSDDDSGAVG